MQGTIHKCEDKLLIDLPVELAQKLGWTVGDILSLDRVESGIKISRAMTAHDHVMEIAREGMDEYRETLAILAKS